MKRPASGRRGFTLPELLLSLLLLGVVVQGGWTVFATFRRGAETIQEQAEALETVRTVAWILGQELAGGARDANWWGGPGDSLALRAFRGLAFLRERRGAGELAVCYRGLRSPDAEKDSLLVLDDAGGWHALDLLARIPGGEGCWDGTGGREELWTVETPPGIPGWHVARVFEMGSYHFTGKAFRYRGGRGGRQPLTPEVLREGSFHPTDPGPGGVEWRLVLEGGGAAAFWRGWVP